jgi:hypothetical protein
MEEKRTTEESPLDAELREILAAGEAGVGDLMAIYERIEERYVSAVMASAPSTLDTGYSTHT